MVSPSCLTAIHWPTHTYILLIQVDTQMEMAIITKRYALGHCWIILQRHLKVTKEVSSPGFISLIKGLLHLNLVQEQFHIFMNYPIC
jgi:hypothetical protein